VAMKNRIQANQLDPVFALRQLIRGLLKAQYYAGGNAHVVLRTRETGLYIISL